MKNILLICLYFALLYITCCGSAKMKKTTSGKVWDRALRSGRDREDDHGRTEMTPGQYCLCSKIYDPVCASNNESYFNFCYLECKVSKALNVTVVHQGNCIPY
ncbi:hypothetical protein PYW07_010473 [Mythimna separata]|uniref:Kazal-like domain-containing protein n=1 Tax=Mythimna separata TaxID=271217 RepID=A0AAD7YA67_MYTSE|nr:hypothetical protein PYW07_010473 [Mythimna separata]